MKKTLTLSKDQLYMIEIACDWYAGTAIILDYPPLQQIAGAIASELAIKIKQKRVIEQGSYTIKLQYSQALALNYIISEFSGDNCRGFNPIQGSIIRTTIHMLDGAIKGSS